MDSIDKTVLYGVIAVVGGLILWSGLSFIGDILGAIFQKNKKD